MKKTISLLLSVLMIITAFCTGLNITYAEDKIPAPSGLKCTYYNPSNGYADFEWNEVKFPPLPESVPLTAYDPESGYTFYWSTDKKNWESEERTINFVSFAGELTPGKTYYVKVCAWIRTWSRVGSIHASYNYSEDSAILEVNPKKAIPSDKQSSITVVTVNEKKAYKLVAEGKTVKLKASALKKKAKSVKAKKAIKVFNAKGKLTYEIKKGNKKITVNKKTGKITVKKGLKKGTYKVKIRITSAGNSSFKPASATVTVKIKVK